MGEVDVAREHPAVATAVWAAHAVNPASASAAQSVSGAYAVTFSVKAPSTIQAGSTVTCKARIEPAGAAQANDAALTLVLPDDEELAGPAE